MCDRLFDTFYEGTDVAEFLINGKDNYMRMGVIIRVQK